MFPREQSRYALSTEVFAYVYGGVFHFFIFFSCRSNTTKGRPGRTALLAAPTRTRWATHGRLPALSCRRPSLTSSTSSPGSSVSGWHTTLQLQQPHLYDHRAFFLLSGGIISTDAGCAGCRRVDKTVSCEAPTNANNIGPFP